MNIFPGGDDRSFLFASYARLRLRLFLREILQLHQRFLVAFFYFIGLILSGNEQFALRKSLAHLLSVDSFASSDLVLMICFLLYAWIVAGVVRASARGGRVHYFSESLPLPFAWERMIRGMALGLVNTILIILAALGLHHLILSGGSWPPALPLVAAYACGVLGSQLCLLEHAWKFFFVWIVLLMLLVMSKGSLLVWPCMGLTAAFAFWSVRRPETRTHDHPELPIGTWEARLRSSITRRFPPAMMMQISYTFAKPALLIYCSLAGLALNAILWMVLVEAVPLSQKIHVYTVITGILGILLSSFFRSFHLQRQEWQIWLNSLPQEDAWWLKQDTRFVLLLYLLFTVPISGALLLHAHVPTPLPFMVLPLHGLSFLILRRMQRSRHMENSIVFILGLCVWFLALGYACDHALQRISG